MQENLETIYEELDCIGLTLDEKAQRLVEYLQMAIREKEYCVRRLKQMKEIESSLSIDLYKMETGLDVGSKIKYDDGVYGIIEKFSYSKSGVGLTVRTFRKSGAKEGIRKIQGEDLKYLNGLNAGHLSNTPGGMLISIGKHAGKRVNQVPERYLRWAYEQHWIDTQPALKKYIKEKIINANLKDKSLMPFGQYRGIALEEIPVHYLLWLYQQDWIDKYPSVKGYITDNLEQCPSK